MNTLLLVLLVLLVVIAPVILEINDRHRWQTCTCSLTI